MKFILKKQQKKKIGLPTYSDNDSHNHTFYSTYRYKKLSTIILQYKTNVINIKPIPYYEIYSFIHVYFISLSQNNF